MKKTIVREQFVKIKLHLISLLLLKINRNKILSVLIQVATIKNCHFQTTLQEYHLRTEKENPSSVKICVRLVLPVRTQSVMKE